MVGKDLDSDQNMGSRRIHLNIGLLFVLVVLSLFGMIQGWVIVEETIHVMHGKGAKSVCLDFNMKINDTLQQGYITAHTVFNPAETYKNVEEYYDWRSLSERICHLLEHVALLGGAFLIGYAIKPKHTNRG